MKAKDLKNSILQMAVEGKLVPQDPDDEPASVLLERIREEKHRLVAEGKAKFPKNGESFIYTASDGSPYEKRVDAEGRVLSDESVADEMPFDLPEGWCWTRFTAVCFESFTGPFGSSLHKSDYVNEGVPVVNPANIVNGKILPGKMVSRETRDRLSSYVLRAGNLVIARRGKMGRAAIVSKDEDGWLCGTGCFFAHISDEITSEYWTILSASTHLASQLEHKAVGTTMKNLNLKILDSLILPLPPLAEQRRIAGRVSQLMPLVEAYGELEDAREGLDAALPDRLRRSVLREAVRGRLAPQDPSDEPASELLGRIRAKRRALAAEGKVKLPKGGDSVIFTGSDGRRYEKRVDAKGRESEPVCIEGEIPFEIPEGWEWTRLGTVFSMQAGKNIKASDILDNKSVEALYPCFGGNGIRGFVSKPNVSGDHPLIGRQGALCGNVQRATGAFYATEHAVVVTTFASTNVAWACMFLTALNLNQYATATAQPGLAVSKLCEVLIPFPPLMEQTRIVTALETTLDVFTNQ